MIWRTRLLYVVAVAIGLLDVTWFVVRLAPVTTATLPELSELMGWSITFQGWAMFGAVLLVAQQVRWVRPLFSLRMRIVFGTCCAVSTALVLLSPYAAVRVGIPRLARVETEAARRETLSFLRQHRLFTCAATSQELNEEADANASELQRVIARYGFEQAGTITGDSECAPPATISLGIRRPHNATSPTMTLRSIEERLKTGDAAMRYANGDGFVPLPSGFALTVIEPALFFGLIAGVAAKPRRWSLTGAITGFFRQNLAAVARYEPAGEWVAARWPSLWSTQIHASVPDITVLTVVSFVAIYYESNFAAVLLVGALTPALLGTRQRCMRTIEPPAFHDATTFVVHFLLLFCVVAIPIVIQDRLSGSPSLTPRAMGQLTARSVLYGAWFGATMAGLLQVSRRLPMLYVLLGYWTTAVAWLLGNTLVQALRIDGSELFVVLLIVVVGWILSRQERRPALAATATSMTVSAAPALAAMGFVENVRNFLELPASMIVAATSIAPAALSAAAVVLVRRRARYLSRVLA
jgi:hypothetical protein